MALAVSLLFLRIIVFFLVLLILRCENEAEAFLDCRRRIEKRLRQWRNRLRYFPIFQLILYFLFFQFFSHHLYANITINSLTFTFRKKKLTRYKLRWMTPRYFNKVICHSLFLYLFLTSERESRSIKSSPRWGWGIKINMESDWSFHFIT